jgi:hypothetical protein
LAEAAGSLTQRQPLAAGRLAPEPAIVVSSLAALRHRHRARQKLVRRPSIELGFSSLINLTRRPHERSMPLALLIPTACLACNRTWLARPAFEANAVCPYCHGQADVTPGECYREDDVALFAQIESAVFAQQLSETESYRLWVQLSNASERWRKPDALLLPVIEAIPALGLLMIELGTDRAQLARVVGMSLAAITTQLRTFEARRRSSGLPRAVQEPPIVEGDRDSPTPQC